MDHISFKGIPSRKNLGKYTYNPGAYRSVNADEYKTKIKELLELENALIVDTETTGLDADARIIELSVINLKGETVFSELFNPGFNLPEKITEITGITDEMLEHKPYFLTLVNEIIDLLEGATLIAWNSDFDSKMIWSEIIRCGTKADLNWVDAMELYSYASGRQKKYCKLVQAKTELGVGENQEHRALSDCLDTLAVLRKTVKEPEDLFSMADTDEGDIV